MSTLKPAVGQHVFLPKPALAAMVKTLREDGYRVVAPALRDGVMALRPVETADQIVAGLRDEQESGHYRLKPGDASLLFQYVVGPDSPKRYVFPPAMRLFQLRVKGDQLAVEEGPPQAPRLALVGIRPCDAAALRVLDHVFATPNRCESDAYYMRTRREMMTIVVNCSHPGGTCFCASMGTGPQVREGFDLALTELRAGFVVKVGSAAGAALAGRLETREPMAAETELAELRIEQAREHMGRRLDTRDLPELLTRTIDHAHWESESQRCLACGNCTMVCPTCFCSSIVDSSDLSGSSERSRVWDCCYTHQFTYTTSGPVRSSILARHRHWVRHKLGTFFEQFGAGGCVGCGRCITWCPAGIDMTKEVQELRQT